MNYQDRKTHVRQMGRWAGRQIGKSPLTICLAAYPPICLLLGALVVSSARAQVPSHSPTVVPEAFATNAVFQPVGRTVVRVNGAVLTDRDLLREMLTIFPYARVHNGFPKAMEADIRDGAMKMMIFEELVYQEAKRRKHDRAARATGARHGGVPPAVSFPAGISAVPPGGVPGFAKVVAGEGGAFVAH